MIAAGVRKPGRGCYQHQYMPWATEHLGLVWTKVEADWTGVTVNSVAKFLKPSRKYLIHVRGHALAYANGEVQDWTADRKHRIEAVYCVGLDAPLAAKPTRDTSRQDQLHAMLNNHWALERSGKNKLRARGHDGYRSSSVYFELLADGTIQVDLTEDLACSTRVAERAVWTYKKGRCWLRTTDVERALDVLREVVA